MADTVLIILLGLGVIAVAGVAFMRRGSKPRDFTDEKAILGEVDVYIAYGRKPQAIDLLKAAVRASPENEQYKQKLLELKHG